MPLACGGANSYGVGEWTGRATISAQSAGSIREARLAKRDQVVGGLLYLAGRTQEAAAEGVMLIEGMETPATLPIRPVIDLGLGLTTSQATEGVGEVVVTPLGVAAARAVLTSLCAS